MIFLCYPKCSTCRKARQWLDAHAINYIVRDIVSDRPTRAELERWHQISGVPLKRFWNTSGIQYRQLGLKNRLPQMTEAQQIELLATDGMLLKRPLLVGDNLLLVGFKRSEWEAALDKEIENHGPDDAMMGAEHLEE